MAIKVRLEDEGEVSAPKSTHGNLFIDKNGKAKIKRFGGSIVSVGSLPTVNWKNGVPGNPYVNGDTVVAEHNSIVMIQCEDPGVITIQYPAITSESAAQRVGVRNVIDKKATSPGTIVLSPDAADAVEAHATGQDVAWNDEILTSHFDLESDGVGRWNVPALSGGGLFLADYPAPVPV